VTGVAIRRLGRARPNCNAIAVNNRRQGACLRPPPRATPAACYEIAMRFAQGRNTTPDPAMAAAWLERAARGGLAPAQFDSAACTKKDSE